MLPQTFSPGMGLEGSVVIGGQYSGVPGEVTYDQIVKGVPIQCMVKIKPNNGYQRDDIRVSQNKVGLADPNGRVREEFSASEIYG